MIRKRRPLARSGNRRPVPALEVEEFEGWTVHLRKGEHSERKDTHLLRGRVSTLG